MRSTRMSRSTVRLRRLARSTPMRRSFHCRACRKGYLVPGWRTGWLAVGGGDRLNDRPGLHHEARRRPALLDHADAARDCGRAERRPLASAGIPRGVARACRSRVRPRECHFRIQRRRARPLRSTRCRNSRCPPERPIRISSSTWCMRRAYSACTARDSAWLRPTDISAW